MAEQTTKIASPELKPGMTVRVHTRILETNAKGEEKERIQLFEGMILSIRGAGFSKSFTVRKVSHGVGVERTFQTHSRQIESIAVKRRGDVRQAKLYYLRDLAGKAARIREKLPQRKVVAKAK